MLSTPTDLHAHLLAEPELSLPFLPVQLGTQTDDEEVLYAGRSVGPIRTLLTSAAAAVEAMDRIGLERRAMSVPPLSYRYDLPGDEALAWQRDVNDALVSACGTFPDRLAPVGIVPLQDPEAAAQEARRLVAVLHVHSIEIGTHVAGRNLDDPGLDVFWSVAEELGISIFIHPEHTPSHRWPDYYLVNLLGNPVESTVAVASLIFGGVLDRFPGLRFWVAHGGGASPWLAGRMHHGWLVRPETRYRGAGDPLEILARNFWFDSLTHDVPTLAALVGRVGADRVVLGSDAPFDMQDEDALRTLERAMPDSGQRELVAQAGNELLCPAPRLT